jgi:hypothetical protein
MRPSGLAGIGPGIFLSAVALLAVDLPVYAELEVTTRFELTDADSPVLRVETVLPENDDGSAACYIYFSTPEQDEYDRFEMEQLAEKAWFISLALPESSVSDLLYYVEAVDDSGRVLDRSGLSLHPRAHRYDPGDEDPPRLARVSFPDVPAGEPLRLSGEVYDPSGIGGLAVFFRPASAEVYSRQPIQRELDGNFTLVLPDSLSLVPGVEYYIEAWDLWGNMTSHGSPVDPEKVFVRPGPGRGAAFGLIDRPIWMGLISVPTAQPVEPGQCLLEFGQFVSDLSDDLLHRMGMNFRFDLGRWARLGFDYGPREWSRFSLAVPIFGGNSGFLARRGSPYSRTSLMLGLEEGGGHYMVAGRDFSLFRNGLLNTCIGAGRGRFTAGDPDHSLGWFTAVDLSHRRLLSGLVSLTLEKDAFNWHATIISTTRPGLRLKLGWRVPGQDRGGLLLAGAGTQFHL